MRRFFFVLLSMVALPLGLGAQTAFEQELERQGIVWGDLKDWSESAEIQIPEPRCAYVNLTLSAPMPETKDDTVRAWMEVCDGQGNGFRKRALLMGQGISSMLLFPKKNVKVQFCEDDWLGEKTTKVSIGDWVVQDSYHFKAYYNDFFRGVAVVGYQLYDQIASERGRMWARAGVANADAKARCYPDGFPCMVYVNGDFYGIFAWQLKKHRRNMNQEKKNAAHIHLDGTLTNETMWAGKISWGAFEVRNPKSLYTMDGRLYDGDHPTELIDETSPFYDLADDEAEVRANKQRTAQVKRSLKAFADLKSALSKAVATGGEDAVRAEMERLLDVPGMIDYLCFHFAVNNYDGFGKNWQWFTYDGVKWFVAPYDLDCTFGNDYTGYLIYPAEWDWPWSDYRQTGRQLPFDYLKKYYWEDIKARYAELRDEGILSPANVKTLVCGWCDRVDGEGHFAQEWARWADCYCINPTVCNEHWATVDDWSEYGRFAEYDPKVTYRAGDKCTMYRRLWVATGETTGVSPCARIGYRDSLERVCAWIDRRFELEDAFLGYEAADDVPAVEAKTGRAGAGYADAAAAIYTLSGWKVARPRRGLNIIRQSDGQTRKVFVK